jgi:pSer/pThr/pTyr-binding forkhead associated (FHA) protein
MSALTLKLIQIGFLGVLWLFVLIAASVMRADLFGARAARKAAALATRPVAPAPVKAPKQPRSRGAKSKRATPGSLAIIDGPATGATAPLSPGGVTLGRALDNTLVLADDYASSRHARFYPLDGAWYVEDLGSTNGTHVGTTRITGPAQVNVGTTVRLGKTVIEVRP